MSVKIIALMLGVSILMGLIALFALLWGLKTKQFDDHEKFIGATKNDSVEALNDAYKMEQKKKEAIRKKGGYKPPD